MKTKGEGRERVSKKMDAKKIRFSQCWWGCPTQ